MKNIKYVLFLFIFSCDSDDPVSSGGSPCGADLAGTWLNTAGGMYAEADCSLATTPPTDAPLYPYTLVLSEDCTYTKTQDGGPYCDPNSWYESHCTGTWWVTGTDFVIWSEDMATTTANDTHEAIEGYYTDFTYTLNLDNTILSRTTQYYFMSTTPNGCGYTEYTKQ